MGKWFCLQP